MIITVDTKSVRLFLTDGHIMVRYKYVQSDLTDGELVSAPF